MSTTSWTLGTQEETPVRETDKIKAQGQSHVLSALGFIGDHAFPHRVDSEGGPLSEAP